LSLLSVPLNVHVLAALEDHELPLADLSRAVGYPPATTMRSYLKGLADLGVVERRQEPGFPGSVAYALTPSGRQLVAVGSALESWLRDAPEGPIVLGAAGAKSAVKALVEGWNATLVRALAARALALTELARLITSISYPTLERRLAAMRRTGQLQARRDSRASRGTPYEATPWLRQASAPLVAAVAWERDWATPQTNALSRIDVEALFLLAIPLLELSEDLSGSCRLAVELRNGSQSDFAGVTVTLEAGRPIACVARLEGKAEAWATATVGTWLGWMSGDERERPLEIGGEGPLARIICESLRERLALESRAEIAAAPQ
jgi:DNA-binding HxlR family transcriptional regulator